MNAANAANRAPRSHRATDAQSGAGDQGAAREAPRYGLNFVDAGRLPDPPIHTKKNDTDLPESLKLGIESLSGVSLDSVKVHY
ncbi:MAG TPA: hypothetical protein DCE44_09885, partial [Verrucomicrobiales bacterium]|nr:hypothetical protein [Verrucomicrobiales bacterium]